MKCGQKKEHAQEKNDYFSTWVLGLGYIRKRFYRFDLSEAVHVREKDFQKTRPLIRSQKLRDGKHDVVKMLQIWL